MMTMTMTIKKTLTTLAAPLAAITITACSGQVASTDPQTQTQAQSTATTTTTTTATTTAAASSSAGDHPHPPHHGPPPEAFDACTGKAAGDVCSVKFHDETLDGKCVNPPSDAPDTRIVCHPDKMPPPPPNGGGSGGPPGGHHHGPPPPEVFAACDGKAADAACSVTFGDHTMNGTCKAPPPDVTDASQTRLGCAPSGPPPQK